MSTEFERAGEALRYNLGWLLDSTRRSQREIARAAGISHQTLNEIMRGATMDPRLSTVCALAEVFGVPAAALLMRGGKP